MKKNIEHCGENTGYKLFFMAEIWNPIWNFGQNNYCWYLYVGKIKLFSPALCVSLILFIARSSVFAHIETHICSELGWKAPSFSLLFLIPSSRVNSESNSFIQMIQFWVLEQASPKGLDSGGNISFSQLYLFVNHKTKSREILHFMNNIKTVLYWILLVILGSSSSSTK